MTGTTDVNTYTNFLWVLVDIMETNLMDLERVMRKEGSVLRFDAKRQFNIAIKAIRRLLEDVRRCSESTQIEFGNDADVLDALIRMIVDRYGDNHYKALRMYNILEKMKSENTGIPQRDKIVTFRHVIPDNEITNT